MGRSGAVPRKRDEKLLKAVGARLQQIRQAAGLTQEQLAEAIDVQPVTISRFETGHRALSITVLADVAHVLETSIGELLDIKRPMPKPKRLAGETELVRTWRKLDEERRDLLLRLLREVART